MSSKQGKNLLIQYNIVITDKFSVFLLKRSEGSSEFSTVPMSNVSSVVA